MDDLEWTCMVCGDVREDSKISVWYRPVPGLESSFPETRSNVRYCNDRQACLDEASAMGPWPA